MGSSGDHRVYAGGTATIKANGVTKLKVTGSHISMNVNWPAPVGPGSSIAGSGWGTIDINNSDPAWVAEFDNGNGQVEFVFSSFSTAVQSYYGAFISRVSVKSAAHQEKTEINYIDDTTSYTFSQASIALNVTSFTKGGFTQDQSAFMANKIIAAPSGTPPAGIEQIIAYCYWELGTTCYAIDTSVIFDLAGVPDIAANLRILKHSCPK